MHGGISLLHFADCVALLCWADDVGIVERIAIVLIRNIIVVPPRVAFIYGRP